MRKLTLIAIALTLGGCDRQPVGPEGEPNPRVASDLAEVQTAVVGYYRITSGAGTADQVAPIVAAGHTPLLLTQLGAADLAGIDVLFIDNPNNVSYAGGGGEFVAAQAEIAAWASAGGVLVFHDRAVSLAETVLPGGTSFNIIRDFSDDRDIDVRDGSTLVTNGPGGIITNSSLDGGTSSSHGFAVAGTLPGTGALILSRSDPDEIVTFSYCFGGGGVVYSSIPLDYYLVGSGPPSVRANMAGVYAPNVVAYAAQGFCDTTPPTIEVSVSPESVWPPNHKLVDIEARVAVSDNVSAPADIAVELVAVMSSEPDDGPGNGDGNTVDDIQGADVGTDDRGFQVRAERQGNGPGRVYTVTYRATDQAGNSAEASAEILVPHDKRKR